MSINFTYFTAVINYVYYIHYIYTQFDYYMSNFHPVIIDTPPYYTCAPFYIYYTILCINFELNFLHALCVFEFKQTKSLTLWLVDGWSSIRQTALLTFTNYINLYTTTTSITAVALICQIQGSLIHNWHQSFMCESL